MPSEDIIHLGLLEDDAIVLDSAALQLAALDHPGIDLALYVHTLGLITQELAECDTAPTAIARAGALARIIAGAFGFTGDGDTYDDPDNADLIRVLDRRRGIPVSLAIIYVAAARRLGWETDALNTPGHVLVRIGPETQPVLIDPFAGGAMVGPEQLTQLLVHVLGPGAVASSEHLAPMSNRSILVRLLMNQATRAEVGGNVDRALVLFERLTTIAPSNGAAWWDRARLELARGDVAGARSSLSAMLEVTREPGLRTHICSALDSLSGMAR